VIEHVEEFGTEFNSTAFINPTDFDSLIDSHIPIVLPRSQNDATSGVSVPVPSVPVMIGLPPAEHALPVNALLLK
jgi:hypothetical protein